MCLDLDCFLFILRPKKEKFSIKAEGTFPGRKFHRYDFIQSKNEGNHWVQFSILRTLLLEGLQSSTQDD